jgi:hypothetical protein
MSTPESKIQNKICEALAKAGVFFFRVNNGAVFDQHLNNGYGAYRSLGKWAMKGVPDIIVIIDGVFVGVEVKTMKGKMSPDQHLFKRRLERAGGKYYVVTSPDDLVPILT